MKKMKYILMTLALVLGVNTYAQVGIGTTDPQTTLDVRSSAEVSTPDGVQVPAFTATELAAKDAAYTAAQDGALVFVTAGTGGTAKTTNVDGKGFYYYDGSAEVWIGVGRVGNSSLKVRETTNPVISIAPDDDVIIISIAGQNNITLPPPPFDGKVIYIRNNSVEAGGGGNYNYIGANIPIANTTLFSPRAAKYVGFNGKWYSITGW